MQVLAASCEQVFAMTGKEALAVPCQLLRKCKHSVVPCRGKISVRDTRATVTSALVRGIPVLITNNDIFRAVLPIENVCVQ